MNIQWKYIGIVLSILFLVSCDSKESKDKDEFDRKAMLIHWVDLIEESRADYAAEIAELYQKAITFRHDKSQQNWNQLSEQFVKAYAAWQHVSVYNIGKAEELSIRNYTNIFPADIYGIENNITSSNPVLELPSNFDKQGFPAIDYLLYGVKSSDEEIFNFYTSTEGEGHLDYLLTIIDRMASLMEQVQLNKDNFRTEFTANDGSSATSSVNKLLNDYLFYYEKFLRAAKVGVPAGIFSVNPMPDRVEAYHKGDISKLLLEESIDEMFTFYHGNSEDATDANPTSLESYVLYLKDLRQEEDLNAQILSQFESIREELTNVPEDFATAIENKDVRMLQLYDELQKLVVLFKVDLFQMLDVKVDYVDADGD